MEDRKLWVADRHKSYIPCASMCSRCDNFSWECNHLDFSVMPVIIIESMHNIVQCTNFEVEGEDE